MFLSSVVNRGTNNRYAYAKMLDGTTPIYSTTRDVYSYDIVQMAIDCIATEISKLQPRHIRTDSSEMQTTPKSAINRLFKFAPNELMTTRDFLEKVVWQLYTQYNCFVYPMYDAVNGVKEYTGFYPLNPVMVTFLQDAASTLFVKFDFQGGTHFTLAYSDVIHLRKRFSQNEIMGGGLNGRPDNTALLKAAAINDTVTEGLAKAVKASLSIRGILKINTMLDDEKQQAERKRFEDAITSGTTGILPTDLKGDYTDLKPDPKLIDKDTLEFIQSKVLFWYGVPLKILSGDFNDEQYQAWYEKTLEAIIISLGQAFSKTLFTQRELDFGNEVAFYNRDMMYLSTSSKLKLLDIGGQQGLFTLNEKRKVLGYSPLDAEAGNLRTMSLNHIDVNLISEYQMSKAKTGGKSSKDED